MAQRTAITTPQTPRSPATSASPRSLGKRRPCKPRSLSGLRGCSASSSPRLSSAPAPLRVPPRVGARRIYRVPRCGTRRGMWKGEHAGYPGHPVEGHGEGGEKGNHIPHADRPAGGGRPPLGRLPAGRGGASGGGATAGGGEAREAGGRPHNTADPAGRTTTRRG